jgi:hypothetical protein
MTTSALGTGIIVSVVAAGLVVSITGVIDKEDDPWPG